MAIKQFWIGSTGPYYYDDAQPPLRDPDGVLPVGQMQAAIITDGSLVSMAEPVADDEVVRKKDLDSLLPFKGDGTPGRVLRNSYITLKDATTAGKLKVSLTSTWNGNTIAEVDDLTKGATSGGFSLNAAGTLVTIESVPPTTCVAVLAAWIQSNASGVALSADAVAFADDLCVAVHNNGTGVLQDLTTLVDTGDITIRLTYLTSV